MVIPLGGSPAECTITGHCRTFVFGFPGAYLLGDGTADPCVVYLQGGFRAAIVSDLPAYFEREPGDSLHYSIDVSLRAAVRSVYQEAIKQSSQPGDRIFLVIEEYTDVPPTVLNSGECFTVDEYRDGRAIVEGGREGKRTLLAIRTIDGSWPSYRGDPDAVNVVLTAVKIEQRVLGHIEQLYHCSCFVSSDRQAVYKLIMSTGMASARIERGVKVTDLKKKADRIGSILRMMMSDSEPVALELFDSMVFAKSQSDEYLRLQYLRLWQAIEDAGDHLGQPQPFNNDREVVAGKKTPTELRKHRRDLAHWYVGRIDHSYLSDLQHTAMELLRRRYGAHEDG